MKHALRAAAAPLAIVVAAVAVPAAYSNGARHLLLRPKVTFGGPGGTEHDGLFRGRPPYPVPNGPGGQPGWAAAALECVDEAQYMVDEPFTVSVYFTTNGSLPTLGSPRRGLTVKRGCRDPVLNQPGPLAKNRSASPVKGVFVEWNLSAAGIYVWPQTPVRLVRALFVATSGAKVLGAMRVRFTHEPEVIGGRSYPPNIVTRFDTGACPGGCRRR